MLSVKQRGTIKRAVRAAPMTVGAQVHANLDNFSPGRRVPYDQRSRNAVARLVRRERASVIEKSFPGIKIDGSEGSMNELAESVSFEKLLLRHNDPADSNCLDPLLKSDSAASIFRVRIDLFYRYHYLY